MSFSRKSAALSILAVTGAGAALTGCTPDQVASYVASRSGSSSSVSAWAAGSEASAVRNCESGNNYSINTGNGYYGAYQFDLSSWYANGGSAYASRPDLAPAWAQDQVAYNYWSKAGWSPWSCKP